MRNSNILKKLSMAVVGATAVALGWSSAAPAATFYVSDSTGKVGTVDQATGVYTQVASGPEIFTDIALSSTNNLFGISFFNLYSINTSLGTSSLIGNLGANPTVGVNALGFTNTDVLYGAGGSSFYQINTSTGAATLVANIGNFVSSGDLVFDPTNNRFLATSSEAGTNSLWSIALNGTANRIGNIGFDDVFGLAFDDNGTLFGYTADRQQITIDIATGAGSFRQNVTGLSTEIFGSASLPSTGPSTSVPEPATVIGLLAVGALATGSRRKGKNEQKV